MVHLPDTPGASRAAASLAEGALDSDNLREVVLRAGTLSPLPSLIQVQLLRLPTIQFPSPRASQPIHTHTLRIISEW